VALQDDVTRLTAVVVRLVQLTGQAEALRRAGGLAEVSQVAKAAGATPAQVFMWERGEAQPTTAQALAWLDYVTGRAASLQAASAATRAVLSAGAADMAAHRAAVDEMQHPPPEELERLQRKAERMRAEAAGVRA
jgi:transcriptional regulator with XRE-family HTH domain